VFNPLSSYDSISNFEDYINHYIYLFLLGGTLVLNELHFDSGEQRQLNELLLGVLVIIEKIVILDWKIGFLNAIFSVNFE